MKVPDPRTGTCAPLKERDEYQVLREGIRDIERLLRYEKRACSPRKKAVRAFKAIKLTRP